MAYFSHGFRVRFADVDSFRISYFSRAFEYAHAAFEELLVACGLPLKDIIDTERVGMPLVHAEADYVKPMYLGEQLEVRVTVERVGASSITFGHAIIDADGVDRARLRFVHAFIAREEFTKAAPIPVLIHGLERLGLLAESSA